MLDIRITTIVERAHVRRLRAGPERTSSPFAPTPRSQWRAWPIGIRLREALRDVEERTFDWEELDVLVGGLPASARNHRAFWSGARSGWSGFTTTDVVPGRCVTFVRADSPDRPVRRNAPSPVALPAPARSSGGPDIVLVGCVKRKQDHAAPAKELYVSDLFRKARRYAEETTER